MPHASKDTFATPRRTSNSHAWTRVLERILAVTPVDLGPALTLCLEICQIERESVLGVQACRAYAALRRSQGDTASDLSIRASIRELEGVRLAILESQRRPFGKAKTGSLILERKLLQLPEMGPLTAKEINAAFRAGAHDAHPDQGGSPDRFVALTEARDALLRGIPDPSK